MWNVCAARFLFRDATTKGGRSPGMRYGLWRGHQCYSTTTDAPLSKVAFVGLGNMGLPMAMNLAKETTVLAFDTNPETCAAATERGIKIASSVEEIGNDEDCQVIFTMLPGCSTVDDVMTTLWDNIDEASPSRILVDCSTVSPMTSRRWHDVWMSMGHTMLDAPVSGGVKGATDGSLTFMVGCHHEDGLEQVRPYFALMGHRVISCGLPGSGAATKLCNNLALAAQMIGICEALNLGEALGVDPVVLTDVMNTSTAKCWSCEVNNPHPVVATVRSSHGIGSPASRDYDGGFGTKLMLKDLGLAVQAAERTGVALPLTTTSKELYKLAELRGLGNKDFGVMLQFLKGK
jgi:3-hydroxyisobutyrate dehydrogenase